MTRTSINTTALNRKDTTVTTETTTSATTELVRHYPRHRPVRPGGHVVVRAAVRRTLVARFVRLTRADLAQLTRGELLDRIEAEQAYWHRKQDRGQFTDADRAAFAEFREIMHATFDPAAATRAPTHCRPAAGSVPASTGRGLPLVLIAVITFVCGHRQRDASTVP